MPLQLLQTSANRPGGMSTAGYQSRMVERFLWFLAKCEKPQMLDLGPVIGKNISFFLNRVARLAVCDMMRRLGQEGRQKPTVEAILPFFDHADSTFDCINLWDIPDHLDSQVLANVVERSSALLKPNGLLMMIASNSSLLQPFLHYLVTVEECNVTLEKVATHTVPYFHRSNRDIQIAFKPLEQYSSFVCMNGIREFLFRRQ
jgi:2-polyprenyl-3-methyl-5-hydroxy-6-metoxy-1,4-benzoquinol methylase